MKIATIILLALIAGSINASQEFLNNESEVDTSQPIVSRIQDLAEGGVCQEGGPLGKVFTCKRGLTCRQRISDTKSRLMNAKKFCLIPLVAKFEECFKSTPNFGNKKECDTGLECRSKTGMPGSTHFCLPETVSKNGPGKFVTQYLNEGEVCHIGAEDNSANCIAVLECRVPVESAHLMGAPKHCLPLLANTVCYQSTPDFGPRKKCDKNLECISTNNTPGFSGGRMVCLPVSSGKIKLSEGEICGIKGTREAPKDCDDQLECRDCEESSGLRGARQLCLPLKEGSICLFGGASPSSAKRCMPGLRCRQEEKVGGPPIAGGDSSKCLPYKIGEQCWSSAPGYVQGICENGGSCEKRGETIGAKFCSFPKIIGGNTASASRKS
jgi:hypothetical protein